MFRYKGIVFAKDYKKSLAEFKKDFGSNHIFKEIPSLERDRELEKVYDKLMKHNGELPSSPRKSKAAKKKPSKE